jgi:cytochrome c oxidase cbb3-type subunit I
MTLDATKMTSVDRTKVDPMPATGRPSDPACRSAYLSLFVPAAAWLVLASIFSLVASIKFHMPAFLAECPWLTYGRVWPASTNSLLYGFCIPAGLGVTLWLFAQLGKASLISPGLATIGALGWNIGVAIGIGGILNGDSTGFESLELPGYAAVFLGAGYALIGICAALTFHSRSRSSLFPGQWFLLAALLWFPWIFSTAELLLVTWPVRGVVQAAIAWWYAQNLHFVWAWLVGLGAAYYFLPKLSGKDLNSRYLALFAFWTLLLFGPWGGIPGGAPLPAWMPAISSVTLVLAVTTLIAVGLTLYRTLEGKLSMTGGDGLLRFFIMGVLLLLLSGMMHAATSYPLFGRVLGATWFTAATDHLNLSGFFCMVMFGSIYFVVPRVLGEELCPTGRSFHFWLFSSGVLVLSIPLVAAGIVEGLLLRNSNLPFLNVMNASLRFLRLSTLGDLMILAANVVFFVNLARGTIRLVRTRLREGYQTATADLFKTGEVKL